MNEYPIFQKTITVAIPACAAVPLFGLIVGLAVAAVLTVIVVQKAMQ